MKRPFFILIFGIFFLIVLTGISSFAGKKNNPDFDAVRFAVIGDRTGGAVPGIYEQIVGEIERMKPDFVITVGDMIEGPENSEERLHEKWTEYLSIVSQLSMPIYYTPGNNDIETDLMEKFYLEYAGQPFYSFDFEGIHIVVMDNSRWATTDKLPEEQINWLIDDLENNKDAEYIIAFYHKPFWERSTVDGLPDSLHSIFQAYGVDAMFSGHYHSYFSGTYDNIMYTNVGSSGGGISNPNASDLMYHFVWVTVDAEGIHVAPIKMGAVLPWDEITADENNFVFATQSKTISFPISFSVNEMENIKNSEFEVTINNLHQEFTLADTLRWDIPDNWVIEPADMFVSIGPDSSESYIFNANYNKTLYPLPYISINFPYGANKYAKSLKQLPIARKTVCHKTDKKPKIDGKINEKLWVDPVIDMFGYDGTISKTDSTEFYFAYDDNYLYLASYCYETDIKSILTNVKEHDGAVYGDDCVGFILQPNPESDTMYLVYINSEGVVFDQKMTYNVAGYYDQDESWNCELEVKTDIGKNYWSAEYCLPLSQFGATIETGNTWGLNMRRKQPRLDDAAHWQVPWQYGPEFLGHIIME